MPSKQLLNPAGAFGYAVETGIEIYEYVAAAPITQNQVVSLTTSIQATPCTVANQLSAIGVSLDTVIAGQICRVAVGGVVNVLASSNLTAGLLCSVSQVTGQAGPSTPTLGGNIGLVITPTSPAGIAAIFIGKA